MNRSASCCDARFNLFVFLYADVGPPIQHLNFLGCNVFTKPTGYVVVFAVTNRDLDVLQGVEVVGLT